MVCPCCGRREPRTPMVCDADRWRQRRWLREVPDLVAMLAEPLVVIDVVGEVLVDERGEPRILDSEGDPVVHVDPVAAALPAAAVAGESHDPHVSGSQEASTPASLAAVDLTLDYQPGRRIRDTMVPKVRTWADPDRWVVVMVGGWPVRQRVWHREVVVDEHGDPVLVPAGDQVGELSVTALLDSWAQAWRERRGRGELGPRRSVGELTRWLAERVDDACDDGHGIAEWHAELGRLVAILRGVHGLTEHDEYLAGVPCANPRCGKLTLWRTNGSEWIECGSCPHLLSADEYRRHTQWLASVRHRSERKAS